MEADLSEIIREDVLASSFESADSLITNGVISKESESFSKSPESGNADELQSPSKTQEVLSFDAYGNLTSNNDSGQDLDNIMDFNYIIEGFENNFRSEFENVKKQRPLKKTSSAKNKSTTPKNIKTRRSSNSPIISEVALKKAFKPSINAVSTTRSGRHCKQKSEDGFLFGTFNFNEIKKLTSNSPKKNRQVVTPEVKDIKSEDSLSIEINSNSLSTQANQNLPLDTSEQQKKLFPSEQGLVSPKTLMTDPGYSSSEEFDATVKLRVKKSTSVRRKNLKKSRVENDSSKGLPKKLGRPRKRKKSDGGNEECNSVNKKQKRKLENDSSNQGSIEVKKRRSSLRNAERIYNKPIGSLDDDVNIIKSSLNSQNPIKEIEEQSKSLPNSNLEEKNIKAETNDPLIKKECLKETLEPSENKSDNNVEKPFDLANVKKIEDEKETMEDLKTQVDPKLGNLEKKKEKELPCNYIVGDLVWVLFKSSPIWPGIVTYPRDDNYFTKVLQIGSSKFVRKYHVTFLCDNEKTFWSSSLDLFPFSGRASLDAILTYATSKDKSKPFKPTLLYKASLATIFIQKKPDIKRAKKWNAAIEEADKYLMIDRHQRVQSISSHLPKKLKARKRQERKKRRMKKLLEMEPVSEHENVDNDEFIGFEENSCAEQRNAKRQKLHSKLGSFDIYLEKHLDSCCKDNPSFTDLMAKKHLIRKWKKLTPVQKARYKTTTMDASKIPIYTIDSDDDSDSSDVSKGMYKVARNEKVCFICGFAGNKNIIKCKGVCNGTFHLECVGLNIYPTADFKCAACVSGIHSCFICKSNEGRIIKCSIHSCGKFYHDSCVKQWPQVSKSRQFEKLVCPRHVCHMCAANADDMNHPAARTAPFTRCIHCPTTYHTGDTCVAAGVEELSIHYHICTKHIVTKNSLHYNVNWCFCCSKGGSLLLCDQCPAAFHAECMNISTPPEDGYVCEDCENGKFPVYGDIVWVKVGQYRWWPSQVMHPKYIPDNIEKLSHQQGMFCVRFFGSNDYFWVSRGRAFLYQDGDQGSKGNRSKTFEQQFQRAMDEAVVAHQKQKKIRDIQEASRSVKGNKKPPPYVKIDTNKPVGNVRLGKLDISSVNKCDCDPYLSNPCSSDDKCLNRMLMVECIREVCSAGDRCQNQRFQKRLYPEVTAFKTSATGWGLKTKDFIKKGDFVIEYVGELIDDTELKRRIEEMHEVKEENYYFLTINTDRIIDAGPKGNLARFMNHSCNPNCTTQKWTVGADTRVGLFALHDIPENSELNFNYNLECIGTGKKKCNCGADKCSGFIGAKTQKSETAKSSNKNEKKKRRRKRNKKKSENDCFRCSSSGGDLLLCDAATCPKGYHLKCLEMESPPKGKWMCPWHYCDECGNKASNRCILCPNSFCRQHCAEKFYPKIGFENVCLDHKPEEFETGSDDGSSNTSGSRIPSRGSSPSST